ncbi:unnamed protein product [Rhizoctonia solani]|uniref:Uncharacterized protein n=1 Tax=Rhizoctonia solani TaxID=456999 RepID=A0A8H2WTB2_9AGAM|nr:unnamed protein product [Rhizoctonia solani]
MGIWSDMSTFRGMDMYIFKWHEAHVRRLGAVCRDQNLGSRREHRQPFSKAFRKHQWYWLSPLLDWLYKPIRGLSFIFSTIRSSTIYISTLQTLQLIMIANVQIVNFCGDDCNCAPDTCKCDGCPKHSK